MQDYEKLPFDLEKALNGHPLVTESGYRARALDNSRKADDGRSLVVLIKIATGEELRSYHSDGTCSTLSKNLYLYKPVTGGWFNIYSGRKVDPTIYGTKKQAMENATHDCVATVHVKWTEK